MAITLVKGTPGSGKSYETVVHHILPVLKDGRKVVTNIPLNIESFCMILGESVRELIEVHPFDFSDSTPALAHPDDYIQYQDWRNDKGQGVLFVLDECHYLFPLQGRGKVMTDLADAQVRFFSGHRHYGFDFIFLTQSDRKINKLIREDIEICIEVRKVRAVGEKSYRRSVYYYGDSKKNGLIDQGLRKYEDQYFVLYKSHTKTEQVVQEAGIKDVKKWHQSWFIRFGIALTAFGVFYVGKTLTGMFSSHDVPTVATSEKAKASPRLISSPKPQFTGLPFGDFDIYIEGHSEYTYRDKKDVFHIRKQVYFSARNKANFELNLRLEDFYLAGYQVSVYGPCMVRLTYGDSSKLVYCHGKQPRPESSSDPVQNIASL
ncbi:zonular occludens toxin domain-containing protein [Vibrio mangrovi]|uniref:Zona occludens toxin n=1 Tax=Vibrio mangrovi TaxID=474394 RepID=A0A1Y6IUP7_9VIBR|nr:zonular occludens toxin domain-containing protein [Vibrio mangrovi]MDW6004439.1 zonular occludens toxin domain-containing protein [Vibrio mangrovi]MDW6004453.1 zonular occludens toxin domain-containing protein [Vibrio mangrovi]SMS00741.1 Zona occludens toxin [Vibrio mangrovi]